MHNASTGPLWSMMYNSSTDTERFASMKDAADVWGVTSIWNHCSDGLLSIGVLVGVHQEMMKNKRHQTTIQNKFHLETPWINSTEFRIDERTDGKPGALRFSVEVGWKPCHGYFSVPTVKLLEKWKRGTDSVLLEVPLHSYGYEPQDFETIAEAITAAINQVCVSYAVERMRME